MKYSGADNRIRWFNKSIFRRPTISPTPHHNSGQGEEDGHSKQLTWISSRGSILHTILFPNDLYLVSLNSAILNRSVGAAQMVCSFPSGHTVSKIN